MIGFTAAIAAYGPFLFGMLFAASFGAFKSATPVFYGSYSPSSPSTSC